VALVGPVPVPWKPNWVLAPAAMEPLYDTLEKLTAPLVPLPVALHEPVIADPEGRVVATVQPLIADEPAVTVIEAT